MQQLFSFMQSGTARRFVAFLVGAGAIVLTKHFGIELSEQEKAELTALVMGYIAQSSWRETTAAKIEAAGQQGAAVVQAIPGDAKVQWLREQLAQEEARIAATQKGPQP